MDKGDHGMASQFEYPPRTLATYIIQQDSPHVSGHVCHFVVRRGWFLNRDRLFCLQVTAIICIRTCQMATYRAPQQLPSHPQVRQSAVPPLHAMRLSQVITHAYMHPGPFYCSPSGLSELLPARRISSVDKRLMAITELWIVRKATGGGFGFI